MGADPNQVAMAVERDEDESDEEEVLVEEREAEMVSLQNPDAPVRRKGWFLKSSFSTGNAGNSPPFVPSFFKSPDSAISDEPKVHFKGWASSPRQWDQWVAKLLPKYGMIWKKVQIFDAIMASTCRIRRDPSSLFGLISHWSEETNTFLFPWGEVTVTLEDIIILTGFSVLGEPVRAPLPPELRDIENKLNDERLKFNRSSSKKAHHSAWVKEFFERENDELEHAAFLSLWLSRFVLCSHPESTIRQNVFPIAVRLSKGQRIALAPSILSSIYRDLKEIKRTLTLTNPNLSKDGSLITWAPLQILQIWIWERFPNLRPETQNNPKPGQPRVARWHDVGKKLHPVLVQSTLNSHNNFLFRPYAISSSDWYKDGCDELIRDDELRSFAQCLMPCELVGLDCIEQYLPNRVAMQFGFDQDIPDPFERVDQSTWETCWQSFEITADNMSLYVPPQPFEPGLTVGYMSWWREKMVRVIGLPGLEPVMSESVMSESSSKLKSKLKSKKVVGNSPDKKRKIKDFYDPGLNKVEGVIEKKEGFGNLEGESEKGKDLVSVHQNNVIMSERDAVTVAAHGDGSGSDLNPNSNSNSLPVNNQEIIMAEKEVEIMTTECSTNQGVTPVGMDLDAREIIIAETEAPKTEQKPETKTESLVPVPVQEQTVPVDVSSERNDEIMVPVDVPSERNKQTMVPVDVSSERNDQIIIPVNISRERNDEMIVPPVNVSRERNDQMIVPPINVSRERNDQMIVSPVNVSRERNDQIIVPPVNVSRERNDQIAVPVTVSRERNDQITVPVTVSRERNEAEESESSRERKRRMNRERYERYAAEMRARRQAEEAREQREINILKRDLEALNEECMDLERLVN